MSNGSFVRRRLKRIALHGATTLLPIVASIVLIVLLGRKESLISVVDSIGAIRNRVNAVLLALIFAAYATVFLGLVLYVGELSRMLYSYRGSGRTVLRYGWTVFFTNVVIGLAILAYGVLILLAKLVSEPWCTFHRVIVGNRVLSTGVFFAFVVCDALLYRAHRAEIRELENEEHERRLKRIPELSNAARFSRASLWLVSVPTFFLLLGGGLLAWYLETHEAFNMKVGLTLEPFAVPAHDDHSYELFVNGLETGIIAASIVVSQVVFLFLKIGAEYRAFRFEEEPASREVEVSRW